MAALAANNCVLVFTQIPLTLPPAPMNRAAEARATNAMSRVYSMRSWPCSSFQKLRKNVMYSLLSCFVISDRSIAGLRFRDLAITACSFAVAGDGNGLPGFMRRSKHQRDAIVINDAPLARFLERAG